MPTRVPLSVVCVIMNHDGLINGASYGGYYWHRCAAPGGSFTAVGPSCMLVFLLENVGCVLKC